MKKYSPINALVALTVGTALFCALCAAPAPALAADKGPQVASVTATAAGLTQVIPASAVTGDTGRFTPQWLVLTGQQDTQNVYYASGAVTNWVTVYTNTATVKIKSVVDLMPPLFSGDYVLITRSSGTVSNETAKLIGTLTD